MSEQLFASIALTPIATVITNPRLPDNPIAAVNGAFCALTGYGESEILGRNCRFLAGPGTDAEAQSVLREAVSAARPALTELLNYRKDGTAFHNAVMIAPVLDEEGEVAFFLGSQMDVGPALRQGRSRRAQAQEAIRALSPRQRQVLERMIGGYRNKQIAGMLGIDEKTVKMHRAGLLLKLGAGTSADAIRIGVESGIQFK